MPECCWVAEVSVVRAVGTPAGSVDGCVADGSVSDGRAVVGGVLAGVVLVVCVGVDGVARVVGVGVVPGVVGADIDGLLGADGADAAGWAPGAVDCGSVVVCVGVSVLAWVLTSVGWLGVVVSGRVPVDSVGSPVSRGSPEWLVCWPESFVGVPFWFVDS